jgi:glycine oxidase
MASTAIVIGAGVVGLFTAAELCLAGWRVEIYERGLVGQEASWAGGGILSMLPPWRGSVAAQTLSLEGIAAYPSWLSRLTSRSADVPCVVSGMRIRHEDPVLAVAYAQQHGLRLDIQGQDILLPGTAHIHNPSLCRALAAWLENRGAVFHLNHAITDLQALQAEAVVVCAGAWASSLLPQLSIQPVKGEMLLIEGHLSPEIVLDAGFYRIPRHHGNTLVGSTLEPNTFDKTPSLAAHHSLWSWLHADWPHAKVLQQWAGIRPQRVGADVPFIGHVEGRIWANVGHYRNGINMAPASAQRLRALLVG